MLFNSFVFALFLVLVLIIYYLTPRRGAKFILLMILQFRRRDPHRNPVEGELRPAFVCAIMIFCLLWMGNWGTEGFIYFQF